ncbi:MAG TPA: ImmA/IrrE family metallo-endopeptidase [Firmicutes bacterium]|nr:ImmA/IrrE family metallo-endopeptidase [Bacillota bacterium]
MWNPYLYADEHCIFVEERDLPDPLLGLYVATPTIPPTIILCSSLRSDPRLRRCVMAHELGHHETSFGFDFRKHQTTYQDMLKRARVEYKADRWAVRKLISDDDLWRLVMRRGDITHDDVCAYFDVTPQYACLRMQILLEDYYCEKLRIRGDKNRIIFSLPKPRKGRRRNVKIKTAG